MNEKSRGYVHEYLLGLINPNNNVGALRASTICRLLTYDDFTYKINICDPFIGNFSQVGLFIILGS